jgi:PAS domain S-box-containing protein
MENLKAENKILFVDPEKENLELYRLLFKKYYTIFLAESIGDAFRMLRENDIKVVVAEQFQKEKNGTLLLKDIAELFPRAERILLTGSIDNQVIIDAINIGRIFHYVSRPFQADNFKSIIDKAIEKHNLQKQNDILIMGLKQSNKELEYLLVRLKVEEEKFREIFNSTQDPIVIVKRSGEILEANILAQNIFGLRSNDMGYVSFIGLIHNDFAKKTLRFLMMLQLSESALFESMIRLNDGGYKSFEINGHAIQFQGMDALLLIMRDLTERKETEKKVLQAIIQTEESERRRFAQELHDGIGPLLSTAKLYLQWILKPNAKIDTEVALRKIEETLEETIASVREVSNNLSPNTLVNFGLEAAIKTILERINEISDISCKLNVDIDQRLPFDLEATIFRIVGESINNSIKHAHAKNISTVIYKSENVVYVNYQDDGVGFDVDAIMRSSKGNGLSNMKSRVVSMGGEIELMSQINIGTTINCKFFL